MDIDNKTQTRRDFLKTCFRHSIFGGLLALGGYLMFKKNSRQAAENHTCLNQGLCRNCHSYRTCILPQALSAKKHGMVQEHNNNG